MKSVAMSEKAMGLKPRFLEREHDTMNKNT